MTVFRFLFTTLLSGVCLLLSGCLFIDNAILRSEDGRYAIARAEYNLVTHYRNVVLITPAGDFKIEEAGPGDDILLLLHGFGTGEGVWGTLDDPNSPLSVAGEVFDGRVLIANYPITESIDAVSAGLIAALEKIRMKNAGTLPGLSVLGHSLGGEIARRMVREKPGWFHEVALVSSPNTGLRFGILTGYIFRYYYTYYEELMLRHGISPHEEGGGNSPDGFRTSMDDLHPKSGFMKGINSREETSAGAHDVTYHFFIFRRAGANNIFIPGRDDSLISPGSAYPRNRIRRGEFEDVRLGAVVCFQGDVNHYTLIYNPDIMRTILLTLKTGKVPHAERDTKKHGKVVRVRIERAPLYEIDQRRIIERIVADSR